MMRLLVVFVFVFAGLISFAQEVTIHGSAPAFVGKHVYLHQYTDYLSQGYEKLDNAIVDEYGKFELKAEFSEITETFIQIQDKSGILYVDPKNNEYFAYFPDPRQTDYYHGKNAMLILDSLDKHDINTLIIDFETRLDHFLHVGPYHDTNDVDWNLAKIIFTAEGKQLLDGFKRECKKEYSEVENDYFHQYVQYSIAGYELFAGGAEFFEFNKAAVFNSYIKNKPVLTNNAGYMYFLFDFYEKPFTMQGRQNYLVTEDIINNTASYSLLDTLLAENFFLQDKRIRELVIMKGILEEYHSGKYYKPNMIHILDSVAIVSTFEENAETAKNLRHLLTRLEPGYKAPDFLLTTTDGKTLTLDSVKGKYLYLDFFHTQSTPAISEKLLMPDLAEKYGEYIEFISISLDESEDDLVAYLKQHPEFKWDFAHYKGDVSLLDDYDIRSLPSYFLIGPDGRIVDANALRPSPVSPGAEYSTIDRTFWTIKERLKPKKKFNIGVKDVED